MLLFWQEKIYFTYFSLSFGCKVVLFRNIHQFNEVTRQRSANMT